MTKSTPDRVLATRREQLTLAPLGRAADTDVVDGSNVDVALPSIRLTSVKGAFGAREQGET